MTLGDRLSTALYALHWGPIDLARVLDVNERTIRRWLAGQNDPPEQIVAWLEMIVAWLVDNPPPSDPHKGELT